MPYLLAVWTFCIDSFALFHVSNCKSHATSIAFFSGLLGFPCWLLLSVRLQYEYAPNLFMCTLDIFSLPAAALSYFIPFVRKSVKLQSLSIAFSYCIICSPDNYLIADSIFFSSTAFCAFTVETYFTSHFYYIVECRTFFIWHLSKLIKFIITYYKFFCRLVVFSHFLKKKKNAPRDNLLIKMGYSQLFCNPVVNELQQKIPIVYELCLLKSILSVLLRRCQLSTLYFYSVIAVIRFRYKKYFLVVLDTVR